MLYPLKFVPIYKQALWGGNNLAALLGKKNIPENCGESWEISGVQDSISVVENGVLSQNTLEELIEIYMGDLVGDKVYEKFGIEFPLLIKFIDANEVLSIQVHPNDELAKKRHKAYGKTELWYILESLNNGNIIYGFNKQISKEEYLRHFNIGKLDEILHQVNVAKDEVYLVKSGTVHAIGKGVVLLEIQQTSDITYRIFDWNRTDKKGQPRELHTNLAIDAIDYHQANLKAINYNKKLNTTQKIMSCQYFNTNIVQFDKPINKHYNTLDSFVVYICIKGQCNIETYQNETITLQIGETILIPSIIDEVELIPIQPTELIEVYID